jgi:hypothetical protein
MPPAISFTLATIALLTIAIVSLFHTREKQRQCKHDSSSTDYMDITFCNHCNKVLTKSDCSPMSEGNPE